MSPNMFALPVSKEERMKLGRESLPTLEETTIFLSGEQEIAVEEFVETVEYGSFLQRAGLHRPSSLLLYGPPGTGKTLLAHHIAALLGKKIVVVRLAAMVGSLLGETMKNVMSLFDYAQEKGVVLFLDELDAIAQARGMDAVGGEMNRVVLALTQSIDSLPAGAVMIAATNRKDVLDPAIFRRFDTHVEMGLPTQSQRTDIIRHYSRRYRLEIEIPPDISAADIRTRIEKELRKLIIAKAKATLE